MTQQPLVGQGLLIIEVTRSHWGTTHLVRLISTSDQPDSGTSTWQSPQTHVLEIAATGISFYLFLVISNK